MKVIISAAVLLVSAVSLFAQAKEQPRVAMIESDRLHKSGGIRRLVDVWNLAYSFCHHTCARMQENIKRLEKEIADLKCANQPIGDREARLNNAKVEYELMLASVKEKFAKYEEVFLKPVIAEVSDLAKKFAAERGYIVLVEKVAILNFDSVLGSEENVPDATTEFINFCNAEFERRRTETNK